MLRWLGRKILLCCVILGLIHYLNSTHPRWFTTAGRWIGGEVGSRMSLVVSEFFGTLQNDGLPEAVEVFREGLQG